MYKLGITKEEAAIINKAYGEIDRECKLSQFFGFALKEDRTSSEDFSREYFIDKMLNEYAPLSEEINIAFTLNEPYYNFSKHILEYYYGYGDINYQYNKDVNKEYRERIQNSLKKIKDEYCK